MIFGYFCAKTLRNKNPKMQCFQPSKLGAGTAVAVVVLDLLETGQTKLLGTAFKVKSS